MKLTDPEDMPLEMLCPSCKGYGKTKAGPCKACKGRGDMPTEVGLTVLAFVCRNAKRWKDGEFGK